MSALSCYASYFKEAFTGIQKSLTGVPPLPASPGCDSTYKFLTMILKDTLVIVVTLGVFALFTYIYLVKLQPTIVMKHVESENPCPDRWSFDGSNCNPNYETQCNPFDPLNYKGHECEIARSCGTSWKGLCR